MKVLILALCVTYVASRDTTSLKWNEWKNTHGKSYASHEEMKRQLIWEKNLRVVTQHNYEYDEGLHTYTMAMTKFADLENDEFNTMYLASMPADRKNELVCKKQTIDKFAQNPTTVDWRTQGYVTPVKNQLQCGSCWAFSATGSLEGQHFAKTKKLVSLSEQQLIDCSTKQGDLGCGGGYPDWAFAYINQVGGIESETNYPYEAKNDVCRFNVSEVAATLTGCVDITPDSETQLEKAVGSIGPVSVLIDASHISFQLYGSGIYYEQQCSSSPASLDHGVLAVGYGADNGQEYWMVKNSWGEGWGKLGGYIKMAKNKNNNCGIATQASYPIV
uniref:Cathepsin L1-like n=1 Tax=Ciona intestinalis TaxID=7719 RepID=F6T6I0_CIOIN|nr:cathepsin L1-like isoform X1 [Ciona intestinalis]XP_026693026.1 cathepsin L1-like isoform X1 [Ciona intestinalis]|eukprot:XP_002130541.1 cathepsin L1-like isoform X1 [Ciona intestinalis]